MQLTKPRRSRASRRLRRRHARSGGALAAATCALLGPGAGDGVSAQELEPWEIDTAALYYGESDGRVRDMSVNLLARKELREESFLSLSLAFDSLTGASPNGAAPSRFAQTFTGPSGGGSYTAAPGELPLDDSFLDSRLALGASWTWPVQRLTTLTVGASFSDEYDYTHTGLNAQLARDFNNRNTTLTFGVAVANDTINPVGGAPIGLTPMLAGEGDDDGGGDDRDDDRDGDDDGRRANTLGEQSKDVVDFLVGVTQVLNRHTIVQLNYSLSRSDGYLNDPYKILSVVDPVTGDPVPSLDGSGLFRYLYELRPDTREKQSLFALLKRDFNGDVFDISYRYMTDDWDVASHTVDLHYRFNMNAGRYIQPHVRFYTQTAAGFYHTVLFDGQPLPAAASADYRLADLDGVTLGIKYGRPTRSGELSTRLELYQQSGSPSPDARVGWLAGADLYPGFSAVIAQFSYKFGR